MSIKKDIQNHYLGETSKDYETTDYKPKAPHKAIVLEDLMGMTLERIQGMAGRITKLIEGGKISNPHHYQNFKSAVTVFKSEAVLTTVGTSKLVVTPKISGIGISLYYKWNDSQQIYSFQSARIDDPSAVEHLSKQELDVTSKVRALIKLFCNVDYKTVPSYIHAAMFDENGIALMSEGQPHPKFLRVQTVMTIPLLDMLGSGMTIPQLLRGWLNEPNEMVKSKQPRFQFVAYDLKSNEGFLASEPLKLKGGASANRKIFLMTKRGIVTALGLAGFNTIIQPVDVDRLVRGMVMGVEHSSLAAYIVPALQSIRETNKRVGALKTEKSIESFKKSTLNKNDDLINLFNYLRNYPYAVEGLIIEPNYYLIRKELETDIECAVYLTPASISKMPDSSTLELMKVLSLGYEDARTIINVTGYDGTKSPFTKANIKLLKKEGIEITEPMVAMFQTSLASIKKIRERTEPSHMIKARDQLWELGLT